MRTSDWFPLCSSVSPRDSCGRLARQGLARRGGAKPHVLQDLLDDVRIFDGSPDSGTTVINPWARYPITTEVFRYPVLVLDGSRMVRQRLRSQG